MIAHTATSNLASQRVLEHVGFARVGVASDPVDGEVIVWQLEAQLPSAWGTFDTGGTP